MMSKHNLHQNNYHDKSMLATSIIFVTTNHSKHTFVTTKDVFVVTTTCLFCHDKIILGAAPANDIKVYAVCYVEYLLRNEL